MAELVRAEVAIIITIQKEFFSSEIALLQNGKQVSKGPLRKFNPIFVSGILRVEDEFETQLLMKMQNIVSYFRLVLMSPSY